MEYVFLFVILMSSQWPPSFDGYGLSRSFLSSFSIKKNSGFFFWRGIFPSDLTCVCNCRVFTPDKLKPAAEIWTNFWLIILCCLPQWVFSSSSSCKIISYEFLYNNTIFRRRVKMSWTCSGVPFPIYRNVTWFSLLFSWSIYKRPFIKACFKLEI